MTGIPDPFPHNATLAKGASAFANTNKITPAGIEAAKGLTAKGVNMSQSQKQVAQTMLVQAKKDGANTLVMVALMIAGIYENVFSTGSELPNPRQGPLSPPLGSYPGTGLAQATEQAHAFCVGDTHFTSAITLATTMTDPMQIAQAAERCRQQYLAPGQYPEALGVAEAKKIVKAFGGGALFQGGTAGDGGSTGTSPDTVSSSGFTMGSTSNPDQDFWTTVNQLAQQRQWYLFSDGETIYLADGVDLLQQAPAMSLDRWADSGKILSMSFTWDNTAYQYVVNKNKPSKHVVHKSTLQKVQSPVTATIDVICDIDAVRAGDIVYLSSCGPGNGKWLVGDCTRSVFQIYSELTLVPPMAPLSELEAAGSSATGKSGSAASAAGSGTAMAAMIKEATKLTNAKDPYVWAGGHTTLGVPTSGGFDCSGSVSAVLGAGGFLSSPQDTQSLRQALGKSVLPGKGSGNPECTIWINSTVAPRHTFMRLNGQYFGTSVGGTNADNTRLNSTSSGPSLYVKGTPAPNTTDPAFAAFHIPVPLLGTPTASVSGVPATHSARNEPAATIDMLPSGDTGGPRPASAIKIIVLHVSEIANTPGSTADLTTLYNALNGQGLSVHIGIDGDGNVQRMVDDLTIAYHVDAYNPQALGIEQIGFATQTTWPDAQIRMTAAQVAYWANLYNIPLQLSITNGVCQHKDLGAAGGGHHDCGPDYPFDRVLQLARGEP
jgi:hypothetical protein